MSEKSTEGTRETKNSHGRRMGGCRHNKKSWAMGKWDTEKWGLTVVLQRVVKI
jgi:hypothetical protein